MPTHPIRVPRSTYSGTDASKLRKRQTFNELAARLEQYINAAFEERGEESYIFTYAAIASELGLTTKQVREVLIAIDGGYNGLSVTKQ